MTFKISALERDANLVAYFIFVGHQVVQGAGMIWITIWGSREDA